MMDSLDGVINQFEKIASDYEFNLDMHQHNVMKLSVNDIERMKRYAQENRQMVEWLRELKAYKKVRRILSQNRIATDRYGEVVLWDDIKRVLVEVNADEDSD